MKQEELYQWGLIVGIPVTHDFGHFGDISAVMYLGSQQGLFA
jgi:hypothetical protein